jgi:hypothetical protein
MIRSHQTYMSLTNVFFKQALLSIFKRCCEKGTRERKLGLPHYWWTDQRGEAQLKQFMKYG